MSPVIKVDNSFLRLKIKLRIDHLPKKNTINVLDAFGGDQVIWSEIKRLLPEKKINVLGIEKKQTAKIMLRGDNLKFLKAMDLSKFDVIDLDAYGIPYKQLKILFKKKLTDKIIYVTFIQTIVGALPYSMLEEIGIPKRFIRKIPTLFFKNGLTKFKKYLAIQGVKVIYYYSIQRKNYLMFNL